MYPLKQRLAQYNKHQSEAIEQTDLICKVLDRMSTKTTMIVEAQKVKNFSDVQKHLDHYNDLYKALMAGLEQSVETQDPTSKALWNYLIKMNTAINKLIMSKDATQGQRISISYARISEVIRLKIQEEQGETLKEAQEKSTPAVYAEQQKPVHTQSVNYSA